MTTDTKVMLLDEIAEHWAAKQSERIANDATRSLEYDKLVVSAIAASATLSICREGVQTWPTV